MFHPYLQQPIRKPLQGLEFYNLNIQISCALVIRNVYIRNFPICSCRNLEVFWWIFYISLGKSNADDKVYLLIIESDLWNWLCNLIIELFNITTHCINRLITVYNLISDFPAMCLILAKCAFRYRGVEFIWKGKGVAGNSSTLCFLCGIYEWHGFPWNLSFMYYFNNLFNLVALIQYTLMILYFQQIMWGEIALGYISVLRYASVPCRNHNHDRNSVRLAWWSKKVIRL